jgi:hypothetical protein
MLAFRQLAHALQPQDFHFELPSSNHRRKFGFCAVPAPDTGDKKFASSAESVGAFWLRKAAEAVK